MSTTNPTNRSGDTDHFVRALSHDMSANFMLLESSFSHLKKSLGEMGVVDDVAHVDACLQESRRLVDDLALLARTGSVEMEPEYVELGAVLDEVLFEQYELLQQAGVDVTVRHPLPVFWCNSGRLKQIVTNLIRNAARHGCDPNDPRIVVSAAMPAESLQTGSQSNGRDMAAFSVHDNGPGIDPRLHREIFLPGRRFAAEGVDGSGMGLAIVAKLARHYGGSVCIDPQKTDGTSFLVTLPAVSQEGGSSRPSEPSEEPSRLRLQLQLDGRHPMSRSGHRKSLPSRSH